MKYLNIAKVISAMVFLAVVAVSCQKVADNKKVDYMITGIDIPYSIVYLDENGESISKQVSPKGFEEKWVYSMEGQEGLPVYLYMKFITNPNNAVDIISKKYFSTGVLINGKYEYQQRGYDRVIDDTIFEVKLSGIVPFN